MALFSPSSVNKTMSAVQPTIFKSIFKPVNHEHKGPEQEAELPEPMPGTSTTTSFTPRETPKTAQQHELSRTVYSHIARFHVLLLGWKKNRERSYNICKAIYALNLPQYEADYFPRELQPLMESLMEILGDMGDIYEEVTELENRLQALAKLNTSDDPVLTTWSVKMVAAKLNELGKLMKAEYKLLENVIENVAHDRDERNRLIYGASLAPTPFLSTETAFLFSEAGLPFI